MMAKIWITILVLLSWTTLQSVANPCDGQKVAFSASFGRKVGIVNGPTAKTATIVFKNVFINTGNAYSPITGYFTAPLKGAYQFTFTTFGYTSNYPSGAILAKNGVNQVSTYEFKTNDANDSTSNTVILSLNVGDKVHIKRWQNGQVYDNWNHHTTFSGFLLYPL